MGKSAFGPGIKAGGPNYVAQLMDFADADPPPWATPADPLLAAFADALRERAVDESPLAAELRGVVAAIGSYAAHAREEFGQATYRLVGQDNAPLPAGPHVDPDTAAASDLFARASVGTADPVAPEPARQAARPADRVVGRRIEFVERATTRRTAACPRPIVTPTERVPEAVLRRERAVVEAAAAREGRVEPSGTSDRHRNDPPLGNLGARQARRWRGAGWRDSGRDRGGRSAHDDVGRAS
jgi:hypothetical protein